MRYKTLPEPRPVEFLQTVQDELPLVPGNCEDCCRRIRDRTDLQSRDVAREYLTFAQALGLVSEGRQGYSRTREEPDVGILGERFRERVFGAREVLESLESGPRSVEECFDGLREHVPRWERDSHDNWETVWHERTERLLGWSLAFGLVERTADGFRLRE